MMLGPEAASQTPKLLLPIGASDPQNANGSAVVESWTQVSWGYLLYTSMGWSKVGRELISEPRGGLRMNAWDGEVVSRSATAKSKADGLVESDMLAVTVELTGKEEMA